MKEKMNSYQMVLVFAPKTGTEAINGVIAKVSTFLSGMQAEISKQNGLGTKELVYDIGGYRKGDFWELTVESAKPIKVNDINIFLNRETSVIRYLILKN